MLARNSLSSKEAKELKKLSSLHKCHKIKTVWFLTNENLQLICTDSTPTPSPFYKADELTVY